MLKEVFFWIFGGVNELDQRKVTLDNVVNYTVYKCFVCQLECKKNIIVIKNKQLTANQGFVLSYQLQSSDYGVWRQINVNSRRHSADLSFHLSVDDFMGKKLNRGFKSKEQTSRLNKISASLAARQNCIKEEKEREGGLSL